LNIVLASRVRSEKEESPKAGGKAHQKRSHGASPSKDTAIFQFNGGPLLLGGGALRKGREDEKVNDGEGVHI
jgi:hypothetical protein